MRRVDWRAILAWLLAIFFLVGAFGNTFVSPQIAADYARWGYPAGFHYLTAIMELAAAIMLIVRSLRFYGALLGSAVMAAAIATVVVHGEFSHAVPPAFVLGVCAIVATVTARRSKSQV
jgi:hypothetical protein